MLTVDGLLVLQAANCNDQIPAKTYEYLRAQQPLLALTDPAGDTADVIRRAGIDTIARWTIAMRFSLRWSISCRRSSVAMRRWRGSRRCRMPRGAAVRHSLRACWIRPAA